VRADHAVTRRGTVSRGPDAPRPRAALILVPTRELALQTAQVCKDLGKYLKLQIMTSTGGTNLRDDIMRLHQPVHIVVATPGRILDLARQNVAKLGQCGILVMDEVRRRARCGARARPARA